MNYRQELRKGVEENDSTRVEFCLKKSDIPDLVNADLTNGYLVNSSNWLKLLTHPEEKDCMGYRAIHFAARGGMWKMTKFLLDNGANVNQRNFVGNTPLHVTVYYYHENKQNDDKREAIFKVIELLLAYGADPNQLNDNSSFVSNPKCSPFHYAIIYGKLDVLKLLWQHRGNPLSVGNNRYCFNLSNSDAVQYYVLRLWLGFISKESRKNREDLLLKLSKKQFLMVLEIIESKEILECNTKAEPLQKNADNNIYSPFSAPEDKTSRNETIVLEAKIDSANPSLEEAKKDKSEVPVSENVYTELKDDLKNTKKD